MARKISSFAKKTKIFCTIFFGPLCAPRISLEHVTKDKGCDRSGESIPVCTIYHTVDALCAHTALCVHSGARGTAAATPSTHDHIIRHSGDRHLGSAAQAFEHFSSFGDLGVCISKSMPGILLEILRIGAVSRPILGLGGDYVRL